MGVIKPQPADPAEIEMKLRKPAQTGAETTARPNLTGRSTDRRLAAAPI